MIDLVAFKGWLIVIFRPLGWVALVAVIALATIQANRLQKNALLWAMVAAAAYLITSITIKKVSNYAVNTVDYSPTRFLFLILNVHVFSILAGLGVCYSLRKWYSKRHPAGSPDPQVLKGDTGDQ